MPRSGSTRPKVEDIAAQAAQKLMPRSGSTRPKVEDIAAQAARESARS
jgi:hypothetical protein